MHNNLDPYGSPSSFGSPSSRSPFDHNPYAPPTAYGEPFADDSFRPEKEGTYWGGFAAGFLAALIGLLLVYGFGKAETKRGAGHGFLVRLGLAFFVGFVLALAA